MGETVDPAIRLDQQIDDLLPFRVPPLGEHRRPARRQRLRRPQPLLFRAPHEAMQAGQRLELGEYWGSPRWPAAAARP